MATVYEIKIKAVSPWISYDEKYLETVVKNVISKLTNSADEKVFENIEIDVKIKS